MARLEKGLYDVIAENGIEADDVTFATNTFNTSGDNTIIAAPGANKQLRIISFQLQNESAVATTAIVKFGATAKWRGLFQTQGFLISPLITSGLEWRLPANTALVVNLSGANSFGYSIQYYVADV